MKKIIHNLQKLFFCKKDKISDNELRKFVRIEFKNDYEYVYYNLKDNLKNLDDM